MFPNASWLGSTLRAKPCIVVRLATLIPMAQILRSGRPPEAGNQTPVLPVTRRPSKP